MLTQETIRSLNQLTRVCRDGEEFCRVSSARAAGGDLRGLLRERSEEWGRLGDELQALVLLLGGEPATSGTAVARFRRAWLGMRAALMGPTDAALIDQWRRVHGEALRSYAEAMSGYFPERIRRTVGLQTDRIADRLDEIGGLEVRAAHSPGA
jgi:uncharacterized protein (TIGR02284 family)